MDLPFEPTQELNDDLSSPVVESGPTLPGYPRVSIDNNDGVYEHLLRNLHSEDLDRMAPRLWWMSKHDGANISPLHRQRVKSRAVVITEDPKLHLVWIHDRIFIKPLPEYLMSYKCCEKFLSSRQDASDAHRVSRRAALGFLRTYYYLIQHESDFQIAKDMKPHLIPARVTWSQFCAFSSRFGDIQDGDVSLRCQYGKVRLTRLNLYCKILLRKWHYQRLDGQYGPHFARFYGPLLFIFAVVSVILNAMQAELAAEPVRPSSWIAFQRASRGFSVTVLVATCCISLALTLLLVYKIWGEWWFALHDQFGRQRKKRERGVSRKSLALKEAPQTNAVEV